jgi:hypothetical protein
MWHHIACCLLLNHYILKPSYHLRLGLPRRPFHSDFLANMYAFMIQYSPDVLIVPPSFYHANNTPYLVKSTNHKVSHNALFSIILILPLPWEPIFPSIKYFQPSSQPFYKCMELYAAGSELRALQQYRALSQIPALFGILY